MSTLAEIQEALDKLSMPQQKELFALLAERLEDTTKRSPKPRRRLNGALYPALEGLPPDLSVETKAKTRALVRERHATNR